MKWVSFCAVDPVELVEHGHAAHDPPAVADVLLLLGPPVQAAVLELSFAQPGAELLFLDEIKPSRDGQCAQTREDLTRVRFGARAGAIAAIEVGARVDVLDGLVDVREVQEAQQREGVQGAVEKARVLLPPLVARKGALSGGPAGLQYLGIHNERGPDGLVDEHAGRTLCNPAPAVCGSARRARSKASRVAIICTALTVYNIWASCPGAAPKPPDSWRHEKTKSSDVTAGQGVRAAQQVQRREAPVETVETQMLREPVLRARPCAVSGSAREWLRAGCGLRATHAVEALDVADVLVDGMRCSSVGQAGCAAVATAASWARDKRHGEESGRCGV